MRSLYCWYSEVVLCLQILFTNRSQLLTTLRARSSFAARTKTCFLMRLKKTKAVREQLAEIVSSARRLNSAKFGEVRRNSINIEMARRVGS